MDNFRRRKMDQEMKPTFLIVLVLMFVIDLSAR